MFRKKTDLVYSTLQQVQRRMTNQTESGQSQSASQSASRMGSRTASPRSPGTASIQRPAPSAYAQGSEPLQTSGPFTTPQVRRGTDPGLATAGQAIQQTQQTQQTAAQAQNAQVPMNEGHTFAIDASAQTQLGAGTYGQGILLSLPVLCVMVCLWMGSMVIAYNLGPGDVLSVDLTLPIGQVDESGIERASGSAGSGPARPTREHSSRTLTPSLGHDILVLQSVSTSTHKSREEFAIKAKSYNKTARNQTTIPELQPLFGVRSTSNNGLQLYFGYYKNAPGIKKEAYPKMKDIMKNSNTNNKRGYPDAYWVSLK